MLDVFREAWSGVDSDPVLISINLPMREALRGPHGIDHQMSVCHVL
jgi:hypothetical protein